MHPISPVQNPQTQQLHNSYTKASRNPWMSEQAPAAGCRARSHAKWNNAPLSRNTPDLWPRCCGLQTVDELYPDVSLSQSDCEASSSSWLDRQQRKALFCFRQEVIQHWKESKCWGKSLSHKADRGPARTFETDRWALYPESSDAWDQLIDCFKNLSREASLSFSEKIEIKMVV